jgi:hypothetical protein
MADELIIIMLSVAMRQRLLSLLDYRSHAVVHFIKASCNSVEVLLAFASY